MQMIFLQLLGYPCGKQLRVLIIHTLVHFVHTSVHTVHSLVVIVHSVHSVHTSCLFE